MRQQLRILVSSRNTVLVLRGLALLLLAVIPGTLCACILHCTLPHPASVAHDPELPAFYCHLQDDAAQASPLVSPGVVLSLVQGIQGPITLGTLALLLVAWLVSLLALLTERIADTPPYPPPRLGIL